MFLSQKKRYPKKWERQRKNSTNSRKRIQNLKRKTEYLDVAKSARSGSATSGGLMGAGSGLSGPGGEGGGIVDPLMQKYHMDVSKDKEMLAIPASAKKNFRKARHQNKKRWHRC